MIPNNTNVKDRLRELRGELTQAALNNAQELINQWNSTDYSFFDLQYSSKLQTLFGIKVTGTYQRTLSNFILPSDSSSVVATELYDLPTNWYVNASSFDHSNWHLLPCSFHLA
jgi:hypothetical protein